MTDASDVLIRTHYSNRACSPGGKLESSHILKHSGCNVYCRTAAWSRSTCGGSPRWPVPWKMEVAATDRCKSRRNTCTVCALSPVVHPQGQSCSPLRVQESQKTITCVMTCRTDIRKRKQDCCPVLKHAAAVYESLIPVTTAKCWSSGA